MKYTKGGNFTTQEMSMLEMLQELQDVIDIAKMFCDNIFHKFFPSTFSFDYPDNFIIKIPYSQIKSPQSGAKQPQAILFLLTLIFIH